jgi:uncharacterized protein (TIRG00374 family)
MNWKSFLGLVVGAIFLYFAVRRVDLAGVAAALKQTAWGWGLVIVALNFLAIWVRAQRWQYLLKKNKLIPVYTLFKVTTIGLMANDVLPARIGELVRAYVAGDRAGISKTFALATIVLERFLDFLSLVFVMAVVYLGLYVFTDTAQQFPLFFSPASLAVLVTVMAVFIGALVLLHYRGAWCQSLAERLAGRFLPRHRERIGRFLESFINGVTALEFSPSLAIIAGYSVLFWVMTIAMLEVGMWAVHVPVVPWYASALVIFLVALGVAIPGAPGFVGTVQYCVVTGLGWFSVPQDAALTVSIVYHILQLVPVIALGLYYYVTENIRFAAIKKTED